MTVAFKKKVYAKVCIRHIYYNTSQGGTHVRSVHAKTERIALGRMDA